MVKRTQKKRLTGPHRSARNHFCARLHAVDPKNAPTGFEDPLNLIWFRYGRADLAHSACMEAI